MTIETKNAGETKYNFNIASLNVQSEEKSGRVIWYADNSENLKRTVIRTKRGCGRIHKTVGNQWKRISKKAAAEILAKWNITVEQFRAYELGELEIVEISEVDAAEYAITAEAQDSAVDAEIENAEAAKIERELTKLEKMTAPSATAALEILNGLLPENHLHFNYAGTANIAGVTYRHFTSIGPFGGATLKRMIEVVKAGKLDAVILIDESHDNAGTEIKIVDAEIENANVEEKSAATEIKIETKIAANFSVKTLVNGKQVDRYDAVKIARENNLPTYQASYLSYSGCGNCETFATAIAAYAWLRRKMKNNRNIADGSLTITRHTEKTDAFGDTVYDGTNGDIFSDDEPELKNYAEIREHYDHIKDMHKILQVKASKMITGGMTQEQAEQKIVRDILGIRTDEEIAAEEVEAAEKAEIERQQKRAAILEGIANANIAETDWSDGNRKYFKSRGYKFLITIPDVDARDKRGYSVQDELVETFELAVAQIEFIADCKQGTAFPWAIKNIDGQILVSGRDLNEFAEWLEDREDDTVFSLLPDLAELDDVDDEPEIETIDKTTANVDERIAQIERSIAAIIAENDEIRDALDESENENCTPDEETPQWIIDDLKYQEERNMAEYWKLVGELDALKKSESPALVDELNFFESKAVELTAKIRLVHETNPQIIKQYQGLGFVDMEIIRQDGEPGYLGDDLSVCIYESYNFTKGADQYQFAISSHGSPEFAFRQAIYDTPAQVETVINMLNAAIEHGDSEFKFPTVEELKTARLVDEPELSSAEPPSDTPYDEQSPLDELYHELAELNELRDLCLKSPKVRVLQLQALGNAIDRLEREIEQSEFDERNPVRQFYKSGSVIDEFGQVWL